MKSGRYRAAVSALVLAVVLGIPTVAIATGDVWSGSYSCNPGWDLKVQSVATGTVTHWSNGHIVGQWSNGSTYKTRTSYLGSGLQEIIISTTGNLTSQSAVCVCLPGHACAESMNQ